ncbi:Brix domain [Carpediemonas membranifera]|uniref:Brix domain n=1 Tax=Carpediemonas membranifera TaxID=201153 RepID=A0A8J6DXK3_9EUKA|nr:Brix domain [Carpediemonas membranifera]|eukprot:KAG9390309.1 Brix domain [Carpediemonas membranifera]
MSEAKGVPYHRVLVLTSRGITSQQRHLVKNLQEMMPQKRSENKMDTKKDLAVLQEIAELNKCDKLMYFESRKHRDLYAYIGDVRGPSCKFAVHDIHTMEELHMSGNFLKGSRPILSFDSAFNTTPEFRVVKELLKQCFATPRRHPKSKPFIDHTVSFSIVEDMVMMRVYQTTERQIGRHTDNVVDLVEVGPRMMLDLEVVFAGCCSGRVLYKRTRPTRR